MELGPPLEGGGMDGWMNGVLGHFYALSRLNWAGRVGRIQSEEFC